MSEFPAELVELQHLVLQAERKYADLIAALYGHPALRQARDAGELNEVSRRLREVARAA